MFTWFFLRHNLCSKNCWWNIQIKKGVRIPYLTALRIAEVYLHFSSIIKFIRKPVYSGIQAKRILGFSVPFTQYGTYWYISRKLCIEMMGTLTLLVPAVIKFCVKHCSIVSLIVISVFQILHLNGEMHLLLGTTLVGNS